MNESLRERLTAALQACTHWWDVGWRFNATLDDSEIDEARPFVYAFEYRLLTSQERREAAGGPFGPTHRDGDWQFPPPLETIDPETLNAWDTYVGSTDDPVALSRLHDLLWERQHGTRHLHARAAFHAYLSLTDGRWDPMYRAIAAIRALDLARQLNDADMIAKATATCVMLIERDIAGPERTPGISLHLLDPLVALPKNQQPADLAALLQIASDRYGDDPWIEQSIDRFRATLAAPEQRDDIARKQVERWRDEADRAIGMLRYVHRQHALQIALDNGLTDLADQISADIQDMTVDELGLTAVATEIPIDVDKLQSIVDTVIGNDSSQCALGRFGAQGPPAGITSENEAAVDESIRASPLQSLFPHQVIGPNRSLLFAATTEADRRRVDVVRGEGLNIALFAPVAVRILDGIAEHYGPPPEDQLASYLADSWIQPELADRLAAGIGYYWRREYDAAAHMLAPRIEAAIRSLCVALGIPVNKQPLGGKPGGVSTLGALLDDLTGRMDESWRRYLAHLLSDPLGLNLRNDIAHGIAGPVDQSRCSLLVHAVCHLRVLTVTTEQPTTDDGSLT